MRLNNSIEKSSPIRIAYTSPWRSIHPGLQHTAVADLVLSNQYDSLVGTSDLGTHIPLGAKSWHISEDLTQFEFEIDTTKRFSDGTFLSSIDYKRSWEDAFRLQPKSDNNSLADVLSMVEGIEDFDSKHTLSGIQTPSKNWLVVKFNRPFRSALDYLTGNRFSAYKVIGSKFIGTGDFLISELSEEHLILTPNPFTSTNHPNTEFELVVLDSSRLADSLLNGQIDAVSFITGDKIDPKLFDVPDVDFKVGLEGVNQTLYLNGLRGRIFSDRRLRRALQFLVHRELQKNETKYFRSELFSSDPQLFLPFQLGHLDSDEANQIIQTGQEFVDILIRETRARPLIVYYNSFGKNIFDLLVKSGVSVDLDKSKNASGAELAENHYKRFTSDVAIAGYSVAGTDPDSVYHMFGPNGAISSPMIRNLRLGEILEQGRSLAGESVIKKHYQNASRVFLEEAPIVHLGFSKIVSLYKKNTIGFDSKLIRRNDGHLNPFYRK